MTSSGVVGGRFSILYFAGASTYTGKTSENVPAPMQSQNLFAFLEERYPGIEAKVLISCAVTVNLEYVDMTSSEGKDGNFEIKAGDEVAIIPPVSSG